MKHGVLLAAAVVAFGLTACGSKQQQPEQPQGYYQQPPPQYQQPPPTYQQPAPAPVEAAPAPAPAATPAATPAASGSSTPTAIPGVVKNADGTCSLQVPGGQPIAGPCPPGI
jgi:hypothetical protein